MSDAAQDPQQLAQGNSGRDENTERPWLAEIPSHWKSVPVTRVSRAISGGTPAKDVSEYWDGQIPWVTPKDMKQREIKKSQDSITELALRESGLKLVDPEAVLIVVRGMILAHSFPVALTRAPVTINQDMKALVFADAVDPDFATWALEGMAGVILAETVDQAAHGTRAIRMERWRRVSVPVPPAQEQRAIAFFLERETEKIDILMEKKRRLLELLEEKRTALITQAVTRGLDPDVPMKESGVDWLGEIPEHWELLQLRRLLKLVTSGSRGWAQHYADDGALFIRIGNLSQRDPTLDLSDVQYVEVPEGAEAQRSTVRPGDLLISITALIGAVGVASAAVGEAYVNQHVALCRLKEQAVEARWVAYFLLSAPGQAIMRLPVYGGTKEGLALDDVRGFRVLLPPKSEQREIVGSLGPQLEKLDRIAEKASGAISLLQEYRTALISAAVTGKIDVRDKVPA